MLASDLEAAVAVSAAAFGVDLSAAEDHDAWRRRVAHAVQTDPKGAHVAEREGRVVGVASAIRRQQVWILSLLTVDPAASGRGAGRELLAAAAGYAQPGDARLIVSSNDPRALRLYGQAGLRLEPTFEARGEIDRSALAAGAPGGTEQVLDVTGELRRHEAELAEISIAVRGAAHTRELPHALRRGGRILQLGSRGFAVAHRGHGLWLLAARDEPAARALLWAGLRVVQSSEQATVRWITGAQQWAVELVLRAGLSLVPYGALCVGGDPGPLCPYIPSPPFA